jgi:hypothetical protein
MFRTYFGAASTVDDVRMYVRVFADTSSIVMYELYLDVITFTYSCTLTE